MHWIFAVIVGLPLIALAGGQITEVINHGKLFKGLQAWAKGNQDALDRPRRVRWTAQLIRCPFCLSHWACGASAVLWLWIAETPLDMWLLFPLLAFAATRLANLLNDVAYSYTRNHEEEVLDLTAETDFVVDDTSPPGPVESFDDTSDEPEVQDQPVSSV